mmetsp:Transcript_28129/g.65665  ORF Transcript_28129/g.65665 Transcript_28129/m.65665 type:complete len:205 (-) Transcript_28129:1499-2113(-)
MAGLVRPRRARVGGLPHGLLGEVRHLPEDFAAPRLPAGQGDGRRAAVHHRDDERQVRAAPSSQLHEGLRTELPSHSRPLCALPWCRPRLRRLCPCRQARLWRAQDEVHRSGPGPRQGRAADARDGRCEGAVGDASQLPLACVVAEDAREDPGADDQAAPRLPIVDDDRPHRRLPPRDPAEVLEGRHRATQWSQAQHARLLQQDH